MHHHPVIAVAHYNADVGKLSVFIGSQYGPANQSCASPEYQVAFTQQAIGRQNRFHSCVAFVAGGRDRNQSTQ
ncbi:hypothetical protein SDC9_198611 [bioreactor metagenome]|uniref:Uncharacterized protein n=1 Tax=bioreactor metagenome TaxID=1076179 RepID=A0A645IIM3_9ZZZZ